ncbi:peptidyl-prolyl cis-trans isomerase fkbp62-like protein, partial [Trifolium pratense]
QITLELVSWKTVSDVTSDKKVIKKILKEGEGFERPNEGAVVKLKLIGKLQDGTVFFEKGRDNEEKLFEFKTDEEQVIDGLDKAVMTMKKGEAALLTIAPEYAFGSSESQQELAVIPSNSTVYYEVELVAFDKEKESWDMSTEEKIEAAGKKKEEGNVLFKAGKYARASKRYEKAVKYIEYDSSFSDEEKKLSKTLKIASLLNNAACKLKLKEYKDAEKLCTKVLDIESTNVKALYRRAQASIQLTDLDLAEIDIKKALEVDPDNREVKLEYRNLKEKVKEYNKKQAKFYGNMFSLTKNQRYRRNLWVLTTESVLAEYLFSMGLIIVSFMDYGKNCYLTTFTFTATSPYFMKAIRLDLSIRVGKKGSGKLGRNYGSMLRALGGEWRCGVSLSCDPGSLTQLFLLDSSTSGIIAVVQLGGGAGVDPGLDRI